MVSAKVLDVTKASSDLWELDFDLEGEQKSRRGRRGGEGSVWREGSTMTFLLFIFLDLLLNVTAAVLLWVQVFGDTVLLKAGWNEAYRFWTLCEHWSNDAGHSAAHHSNQLYFKTNLI